MKLRLVVKAISFETGATPMWELLSTLRSRMAKVTPAAGAAQSRCRTRGNRNRTRQLFQLYVDRVYMWALDEIDVVLEIFDRWTTLVRIETPVGAINLIGEVSFEGRMMRIDRAHIDGPGAGKLGRRGLNAIGAKLLVEGNVDEIIIQGSNRTTGRNPGRPPRIIRFPSRGASEEA